MTATAVSPSVQLELQKQIWIAKESIATASEKGQNSQAINFLGPIRGTEVAKPYKEECVSSNGCKGKQRQ